MSLRYLWRFFVLGLFWVGGIVVIKIEKIFMFTG